MSKEILTLQEAADLLRISKEVYRQYILSGKVPGIKIGKQYRVMRSTLMKLIDAEFGAQLDQGDE